MYRVSIEIHVKFVFKYREVVNSRKYDFFIVKGRISCR